MISKNVRLAASIMLKQLDREALEVALIPAPEAKHSGHQLRAVENRNPNWYRELCKEYPKNRTRPRQRQDKFTDSLIDRSSVKAALRAIAGGKNSTTYSRRLLPYIRKYAKSFGGTNDYE